MTGRDHTAGAAHDHVLPDGTTVRLRPIRPDDAPRLLGMWQRLSVESIRYRFLGAFQLTEDNVRRFTDLDPSRQAALVATLGRDRAERVVAVARVERLPDDPAEGEFAALVEDTHQGRGIGTALLRHLIPIARDMGITRLVGDMLADNRRMLAVLRKMGLAYERTSEGVTIHTSFAVEPTEEFLAAVAADEKKAAVASLSRFFAPRSVAVVGASRDRDSIGGLVFHNIVSGGYEGVVYPVNHTADVVQSVAAYPDLRALPAVPDLVVVCVPAPAVNDVVDEAGELGVKAVTIVSAGFAEIGDHGRHRERDLLRRARSHGMRVIGPNCMGLANASRDVRLNATFSPIFPRPGRLSFSSQSGALGLAVLDHVDALDLGISSFVSVGNKADISGNDLLLYWENDADTDVILLYLESFGNPRKFARLARRISYKKPIVAVKSGRTQAGRRAASSHTAALAAGDVAVDALFRQTGVIRTDNLGELFDVATVMTSQPLPAGPRVAILTNAGGPGILCADACESHGLQVPALDADTRTALDAFLPDEAGLDNPVDMIASGSAEQYGRALRLLGEADEVDAVLVLFIPPVVTEAADVAEALVDAAADVPDHKPVIGVFMGSAGGSGSQSRSASGSGPAGRRRARTAHTTGAVSDVLAAGRIPSFTFPEDAARALGRCHAYARWRARPHGRVVRPDGVDPDAAREIIDATLEAADADDEGPWLEAGQAAEILAAYGVAFARSRTVATPEQAAAAQRELAAPVACKLAAPIHKSDVGGVRLGLDTPEDAAEAVREIRGELDERGLESYADSFLIQEMVAGGVEMVVGITHDPSFGPVIMAGFGGRLVELLGDVSVRVTPITDVDADDMLRSLQAYQLLTGYRGSPPADVDALEDLLFRVNAMVEDLPEIAELDLNPVFVRQKGAVAVDVRMQVRSREADRAASKVI